MRRRSAVKTLALAAGSTLAGRNLAQASPSGGEENLATTAESAAILIDTTKCMGCRMCERACAEANGLPEPPKSVEPGVPRDTTVRKVLFAVDELSGFLTACALVRPDKAIAEVKIKSVKSKAVPEINDELARLGARVSVEVSMRTLGSWVRIAATTQSESAMVVQAWR